tara:strand:- start:34 stop:294 length:261 start_codon:yes stop_codon:yes gene_type:complete
MTNLTTNEAEVLNAILESDYQVSDEKDEVVGNAVWTWSVADYVEAQGKAFSGVVSSLVKKGFAETQENGNDSIMWITSEGWDAANA